MITPNRTKIITALLATAVAWMGSADAQLQGTDAAKLNAVRDHLGAGSSDADWSILSKACRRSATLERVSVDASATGLTVALEASRTVPYWISFDASANLLVVDLAGTMAEPEPQVLLLDSGGLVTRAATELASVEPVIVTRATFSLASPVAVTAGFAGSRLVVKAEPQAQFYQDPAESAAQRAAFLDAIAAETELRGDARLSHATVESGKAIENLRQALADAKLRLLEHEFAGIGAEPIGSEFHADLTDTIDGLSLELERLAVSRRQAVSEHERLRAELLQSSSAGSVDDWTPVAKQLAALDAATVQRLNALIAAASDRRSAVAAAVSQARVASADSGTLFDALDGAFAALRAEESAPDQLSGLDDAMAAVSAVEPEVSLDVPVMAAVKRAPVDLKPPRARVDSGVSTAVSRPTWSANPFGDITVMHSGEAPVMLAQLEPRDDISFTAPRGATFQLYRRDVPPEQDPLQQPVTIDFRDMDLLNVVSLLAEKGEINVIAGTEVRGTVTASLQDVPLGRAIEIILRMNGLGIVEEAGVYRITTYEEAVEARRETRIIFLQNTLAEDVEETLRTTVRGPDAALFQISSNDETNTVVLSGSADLVNQMAAIVQKLDATEQVVPTVTRVFRLNHAVPTELESIVEDVLSNEGEVNSDIRSRQLVVTDTPGKIADIEELVAELDRAVKQVAIEATIVDISMDDDAQTGIDWVIDRLPSGRVENASVSGGFTDGIGDAATAALNILSGDFDIDLMLLGEIQNGNAEILANPVLVTVENSPARISIGEEFPFTEVNETAEGGRLTSTSFKDIGTILEVTPRITYENEIVIAVEVVQSSVSRLILTTEGEVPAEDEREVLTTLRIQDGQTVFIGGLRKFDTNVTSTKMPLLGNIPVLGFLFGNRVVSQDHVELLVFLTCNVIETKLPELTPYQQQHYDDVSGRELRPTGERTLVESYIHPEIYRDPFYKWRREK